MTTSYLIVQPKEAQILRSAFFKSQVSHLQGKRSKSRLPHNAHSKPNTLDHSPRFPPNQISPTMGKEKDSSLSKDERKALRRAEKEKKTKRSDSDGVHKSKDGKKEKKSKSKKERVALAEKVANAVENGTVAVEEEKEEAEKEDEEMVPAAKSDAEDDEKKGYREDKKPSAMRPVGALVPFANPLADDKVAKKVFKGVKKGEFYSIHPNYYHFIISTSSLPLPSPQSTVLTSLPPPPQPQPANASNAASKKSSKRSANLPASPHPPPPLPHHHPASSSSPPTSRPWTSSRTSPCSARTTTCPTSMSGRGRSWGLRGRLSGPRAW